jgi:hypothetical protein
MIFIYFSSNLVTSNYGGINPIMQKEDLFKENAKLDIGQFFICASTIYLRYKLRNGAGYYEISKVH